jgi:hypothetical protein
MMVNATTLPEIIEHHRLARIDFLKMDCEGAEYEIFRSIPMDVLVMVRQIAMECHNQGAGREPQVVVGHLRRNGFEVVIKTDSWDDRLAMIYARRNYSN